LTAGVALAILALVSYDGLAGRVDSLVNDLDRLGAETVDAIATATIPDPRLARPRPDAASSPRPHPARSPMPDEIVRRLEREREP
jgi:biopolymer transport protein ExbB